MSGRARVIQTGLPAGAVSSTTSEPLSGDWTLTSTATGSTDNPGALGGQTWRHAIVPGTVAQAIGPEELDHHADYDAEDWWYRVSFSRPATEDGDRIYLRFDGLATLAEVWLNGEKVTETENMFSAIRADVTDLVSEENELVLAFRSLSEALTVRRRPRPRWKTRLVDNQALRWFRTTLLGRIPGWTPSIKAVGPWREVWIEVASTIEVVTLDVHTDVINDGGLARVATTVRAIGDEVELQGAELLVGDHAFEADFTASDDGWTIDANGRIDGPQLWWPSTHGEPELYDCKLRLSTNRGDVTIECGQIGFRSLEMDRTDGDVRFVVNGVPVFCRGACWTNNDIVSLVGDPARMRRTLELLAAAHGNMVRVGGTMVYETDDFYRACDELGILVWQDFMFANMDYPVDDEDFAASIREEAQQQLRRLSKHPSVAAFCGGSEVEQQAAMFGASEELWTNDFFSETLPSLVERHAPGRSYWPSTPTEGALPFHVGEGIAHYFGVGAYDRPLEDARTAGVRFTTECLGFSNVPDGAALGRLSPDGSVPPHHPAWKAGVPRDTGAGWDFEDVRDWYLRRLYEVDPVELRSQDLHRYLTLSRTVTGRVMAATFDEWRSPQNRCQGGLVWFLQDLRPGAGWGIIDSDNQPKPVCHHLARAWRPVRVAILDRGLDGLQLDVHNETSHPVSADIELLFYDSDSVVTARGSAVVEVAPRSTESRNVEGLLGHFADPTYSYRFGPRRHQVVAAIVTFDGGKETDTTVFWAGPETGFDPVPLAATLEASEDSATVVVTSDRVVAGARIEMPGWSLSDNYFDVLPGIPSRVVATPAPNHEGRLKGHVDATNASASVRLTTGT